MLVLEFNLNAEQLIFGIYNKYQRPNDFCEFGEDRIVNIEINYEII